LKSCRVLKDHYDDERNKTVFHNTTPDLQDQDQDRHTAYKTKTDFLVSDRSCPKTDGLRPHHYPNRQKRNPRSRADSGISRCL